MAGTGCNFSLLVKKREKREMGRQGFAQSLSVDSVLTVGHCSVGRVVTKHDCALAQGLYELHLSHTLDSALLNLSVYVNSHGLLPRLGFNLLKQWRCSKNKHRRGLFKCFGPAYVTAYCSYKIIKYKGLTAIFFFY